MRARLPIPPNLPIHYLAIDPGKNNGYAVFDESGELLWYGVITGEEEFLDWLEVLTPFPELVILESYKVRPGSGINANTWSDVPTAEQIGAIKRICHKRRVPVVKQEASILPIACKWANIPYKKGKHLHDEDSATAHGIYYLQKYGIRKSRLSK